MRLFVVSVVFATLAADSVVFAGVVGDAELGDGVLGGLFGGYSMSDDEHSGGNFGAHMAFHGGHGFDNDFLGSSGEHFSSDYGGGHGGFDFGGFGDAHGTSMSHEDNAALSAVGLANLLTGGGIGGAHAHLASTGGSSYTISGPTQEIKSIHKISTTSRGGHILARSKGAAAEAPKFILVKNEDYLGGPNGNAALAGGHGGYSGANGGYAGVHGGSSGAHAGLQESHGGLAGGPIHLAGGHGGHGSHEELSGGHEGLSNGHGGHGGHVELPGDHEGHGAQGDFEMGNSLGYGASYGDAKTESGWR